MPLEVRFECNFCLRRTSLPLTYFLQNSYLMNFHHLDARIPFHCACPSNARSRADLKRKALILSTIKNRFLPTLDLDYDKNATAWIVEPQFQFFLVQLHLHNSSKSILRANSYFYHAGTKHPHINGIKRMEIENISE